MIFCLNVQPNVHKISSIQYRISLVKKRSQPNTRQVLLNFFVSCFYFQRFPLAVYIFHLDCKYILPLLLFLLFTII